MIAGILGFNNDGNTADKIVYIVPNGKIAVVNIFARGLVVKIGGISQSEGGSITISNYATVEHIEHKGIVLQAGMHVWFSQVTKGIVTGFEEDV